MQKSIFPTNFTKHSNTTNEQNTRQQHNFGNNYWLYIKVFTVMIWKNTASNDKLHIPTKDTRIPVVAIAM